jgi:type II pantothenate kinase
VKLVYFEPLDLTDEEIRTEGEILMNIRHYLTSNRAYGQDGVRDDALELTNIELGGRRGNLHFIRFPTSQMADFIDLCIMRNLHTLTFQVFATGGGAYKFEHDAVEVKQHNYMCPDTMNSYNACSFLTSFFFLVVVLVVFVVARD